jgi:hypothetical protein
MAREAANLGAWCHHLDGAGVQPQALFRGANSEISVLALLGKRVELGLKFYGDPAHLEVECPGGFRYRVQELALLARADFLPEPSAAWTRGLDLVEKGIERGQVVPTLGMTPRPCILVHQPAAVPEGDIPLVVLGLRSQGG